MMNTSSNTNLVETFERMLQKHNWYYDFSESHVESNAGASEHLAITLMFLKLVEAGEEQVARDLYNQYSPFKMD